MRQFVPYLLVDDVATTSAFYVDHLGFESVMALDWFVSLKHRERPEYKLDFVRRGYRGHEVVPEAFEATPAGMVLAFVVDDAAGAYADLRAAGVPVVMALRDEPWGQRRFMVRDPAGALVELLQIVGEVAPEFAGPPEDATTPDA